MARLTLTVDEPQIELIYLFWGHTSVHTLPFSWCGRFHCVYLTLHKLKRTILCKCAYGVRTKIKKSVFHTLTHSLIHARTRNHIHNSCPPPLPKKVMYLHTSNNQGSERERGTRDGRRGKNASSKLSILQESILSFVSYRHSIISLASKFCVVHFIFIFITCSHPICSFVFFNIISAWVFVRDYAFFIPKLCTCVERML